MRKEQGFTTYVIIGLCIALALSWAAAGGGMWYLDGKVEKAQEEAKEASAALGKEQQSRAGFQAAAKACSESVTALEAAGKRAKDAAKPQQDAAAGVAKAVDGAVQRWLSENRPAGMDACGNAERIANEAIKDRAAAPFK